MDINIKLLNDEAKIPTKGSDYAAGYDLYANISVPKRIYPHETVKIGTGIAVELPEGTFGAIFARSGLATNKGLRPANCVGICDADYRGEYIIAIHNDSNKYEDIMPGERIAQLVILPYPSINFNVVKELSDTVRGDGGFGDSGRF